MIPVCTWCSGDIIAGNRRWPGYDDPTCRQAHRRHIDAERQRSRQARRDARLAAAGSPL